MNDSIKKFAAVWSLIKQLSGQLKPKKNLQYNRARLMRAATIIILGSSHLFYAPSAQAALNCEQQPSCEELGYSAALSEDCPADNLLLCPFDITFKKCIKTIVETPCPLGYEKPETAASCNETADSGWKLETLNFADGTICQKCATKECSTGYAIAAANCGISGEDGWKLGTNKHGFSGSKTCYECVAASCPGGTSTTMDYCLNGTLVMTGYYNGDKACYGCF